MKFVRIKLKDFDSNKHHFIGYFSNRGTELGSPTLPEDWRIEGKCAFGKESNIQKLQKALRKNPKAKASFLIYSGCQGGYGSRRYSLKNIQVEVEAKR